MPTRLPRIIKREVSATKSKRNARNRLPFSFLFFCVKICRISAASSGSTLRINSCFATFSHCCPYKSSFVCIVNWWVPSINTFGIPERKSATGINSSIYRKNTTALTAQPAVKRRHFLLLSFPESALLHIQIVTKTAGYNSTMPG